MVPQAQHDGTVPNSGTVPTYRFPVTPGVIAALAVQTLRQCLRRKVLWVLVLFAAALAIGVGVIPSHEPARYVSALIELCQFLVSFFGVVVAVFLGASVLPEDRAKKTLGTLMTKPVGRLNYLLGRVGGFALTMGLIVLVMGAAGWGVIRWAGAWAEHKTGRTDLLVAKRGIDPVEILLCDAEKTKRTFGPAEGATLAGRRDRLVYSFREGLESASSSAAGDRRLEMLPSIATGAKLPRTDAAVVIANPNTKVSQRFPVTLDSERLTVVDFPASLIDPDEGVSVTLDRYEPGTYVRFAPGAFQIMTAPVPFEWAYGKSLVMVFLGVLLVIVVSVAASTFLGAWVAVLLAFTAYLFAQFQEMLVEHMRGLASGHAGFLGMNLYEHVHGPVEHVPDPWYVLASNKVFYALMWVVTHIFPDFHRFDATSFLTAARDVPASAVALAAAVAAAYAVCYLALAQAVFYKRELMP